MRQKSLQAKLQQSVSLVIVITLLASYMMAIFLVYNQTSASMREEIEKEADYLAAAVSITGEEHLEDLDTAFPDTRITLIDREGTVIYDTDQYEITFVNHLDRPEVVSAAGKGRGSDVRRSDSLGEEMYYYAILLEDGNILRISRAADTALRTAVHILPIVLIIGAGLMLIGLLLTRRRLISLIDPINRIDLNEPMENDIYIELTPLLVRIDQQNKEKEELAQIRQEFSANVSHDPSGILRQCLPRAAYAPDLHLRIRGDHKERDRQRPGYPCIRGKDLQRSPAYDRSDRGYHAAFQAG